MAEKMMGVVYHGKGDLRFEERDIPTILDPRDAIVRVGMSSICTSDFHIRNGAVPIAKPNTILGHEFAGEIVAVGDAVKKFKPGDRVVANVETFCGECFYCKRGYVNNCVEGGWYLGCRIDGCQTEYVRVPIADNGLIRIPENLDYEDVLMVSCILPSGYFGAELAEIHPGDTVAVIGCGPCGYTAMMCARLFGPARIIAIDRHDERGEFALKNGWADVFVNTKKEDPIEVVKRYTDGRGADSVIEMAGKDESFQLAWKLARPNGVVSLIAMYEEDQRLPLPSMYGKNLVFKTGGVDACKDQMLVDLIAGGKLNTRPLITHKMPLNDIMHGYEIFEKHLDGCIKVAITPYER
ncbi:MAG: alcohol dehydrogenase catalytic domain-containing protein [Oscillospiraceae bacterium]|nr:alcohol dehydrogenase catalytic domain-containing protein [Oscillospiraceae bacterium]